MAWGAATSWRAAVNKQDKDSPAAQTSVQDMIRRCWNVDYLEEYCTCTRHLNLEGRNINIEFYKICSFSSKDAALQDLMFVRLSMKDMNYYNITAHISFFFISDRNFQSITETDSYASF